MRRNGGVVALAAINGPGAFKARFPGDDMAKKKRKAKSKAKAKKGLRTRIVRRRAAASLVLKRRAAPKARAKRAGAPKRKKVLRAYSLRPNKAAKTAPKAAPKTKAKAKASAEVKAAKAAKASAARTGDEKKMWAAHHREVRAVKAYKALAAKTPQFRKVKKSAKVRVAYGAFKRYRSPKLGLTYGYLTPKGRVRKIPAWAYAGAPSASAFSHGAKYDGAKKRIASIRTKVSERVAKRFNAQTAKQKKAFEALLIKQANELAKIKEGRSIMAPNKRKKKSKGARKAKSSARRKRSASKRRVVFASKRRTVTRRKKRGKGKLTKGSFLIQHTFRRGNRIKRKRYTLKYKAKRGAKGRLHFTPPGAGRSRKRQRQYNFTANRKRRHSVRRRHAFRRNGAFSPFLSAIKTGAPVLGGFAAHRVLTGLAVSAVGTMLPIPEGYKVPVIGLAVAILGSIGAKMAVRGQTGDLLGVGMAVSTLHQAVMAGLRMAGQEGAASYLAGIPTQRTTAYGAYELVGGMSGFGALPYSQALAGNPFAARGNYLAVPSLGALPYSQAAAGYGAYPEQAAAGYGAYPEQAAAGYGSYELSEGGVTLNGIGTSDAEVERALDVADRQGSVGFGADTVGRDNIMIPDGAINPITTGGELPNTAGIFAANNLGVSFLGTPPAGPVRTRSTRRAHGVSHSADPRRRHTGERPVYQALSTSPKAHPHGQVDQHSRARAATLQGFLDPHRRPRRRPGPGAAGSVRLEQQPEGDRRHQSPVGRASPLRQLHDRARASRADLGARGQHPHPAERREPRHPVG